MRITDLAKGDAIEEMDDIADTLTLLPSALAAPIAAPATAPATAFSLFLGASEESVEEAALFDISV